MYVAVGCRVFNALDWDTWELDSVPDSSALFLVDGVLSILRVMHESCLGKLNCSNLHPNF